MRYIPPDVSKSSWAAQPPGRLAAVQNSALAQATKQWTANSKQVRANQNGWSIICWPFPGALLDGTTHTVHSLAG